MDPGSASALQKHHVQVGGLSLRLSSGWSEYGVQVWKCSSVLGALLLHLSDAVDGAVVLEIGCGPALAGIAAAAAGARKVIFTDAVHCPGVLELARANVAHNRSIVGTCEVAFLSVSWGLLPGARLCDDMLDFVLLSDCFYDGKDFDDVLATLTWLLQSQANRGVPPPRCLLAYQQRSYNRTIRGLLRKWGLVCLHVEFTGNEGRDEGVELLELMFSPPPNDEAMPIPSLRMEELRPSPPK